MNDRKQGRNEKIERDRWRICGSYDIIILCLFTQDAFDEVVKYFGESPKTMPPSVFFPVFVRFVKAYRVSLIFFVCFFCNLFFFFFILYFDNGGPRRLI